MAPQIINVGFIGLSSRPEWSWAVAAHLSYFTNSKHYNLAALQNSSKETAQKAIRLHNLPQDAKAYGDTNALVSDPDVDLVAVTIKVHLHAAAVEAAIRAGKRAVFCEWPLARNSIEAERLTSLAKEKGVRTLVGLQGRQDPATLRAKELVESGALGEILQKMMLFTSPWFGATMPEAAVYGADIENGANLVSISAGHALDALCFVLGELRGVQATLANNRPRVAVTDSEGKPKGEEIEKTAHDHLSVIGRLPGGGVATAVCQGGMSQVDKNFFWEVTGTKGTLLIEGPMGNIQGFPPTIKFVKAEPGAVLEAVEVDEVKGFSDNIGKAWEAFAGAAPGEAPDFEVALIRHRMLDAIYKSSELGTKEEYW
ncbi:oxidoreductase [Colletotrichum nymphaeae SA-01]|uniref:Oxidoreductase n=1 Tax=Colletotrichum nymphaeae SA-01 TaxID=1460502 RepID=A0A135SK00_9PEZI|nr:oxidoreductase [Colletotrichum nymphaeae SA-01]